MHMDGRRFLKLPKTFKRHPRFWFWFLAGGGSLFLLGLLMLPQAIRWGAQRWLRQHGIETALVKDVEFNPFSGRLAIYSVFGVRADDERLNLGRGEVRVEWTPLFRKRLSVSGFTLENVLIDVNKTSDGTVSIGGLKLASGSKTPANEAPGRPWEISIGPIDLHNVSVIYREPRMQGRIDISDAHLDPIDSARPELLTRFSLAAGLNGGNVKINGGMRPFKADPSATASLRVTRLPLAWLSGLAEAQKIAGLAGEFDINADLKATRAQAGSLSVDSLSTLTLRNLRARAPQGELANATVNWGGRVNLAGDALRVVGAFGVADLKARLAARGLEIALADFGWRGELAGDPKGLKLTGDLRSHKLQVDDLKQKSGLALDELTVQSARIDAPTSATAPLRVQAGVRLKGLAANLGAQAMALEQRELIWDGNVSLASRPATEIQVNGNLSLLGFALDDRKNSATLARFASFDWRDAAIRYAGSSVKAGGKIEIAELKSRLAAQGIDFAQARLAWSGDAAFDPTSGSLKLAANATGDGIRVRDFKKDLRLLALEQFSLRDISLDASGLGAGPRVTLQGETHLTSLRARLPEQKLSIRQDALDWTGRVNVATGKKVSFGHEGDLKIAGLAVEDRERGLNLLDLDQAAISAITVKSPSDIEIKKIRLGPVRLLERASRKNTLTTQTHTLQVGDFMIDALSYDGKSMAARSMRTSGMTCALVRGADGVMDVQTWSRPAAAAETKTAAAAPKQDKPDEPIHLRVGRIDLEGDNRIFIRDAAANPPVFMMIRPLNVSVAGFDTAQPDQPSSFTLTTRAGRYANVKIAGTATPFAASPTATVTSRIESIDLPVFTPYTQQYIGYRLASGTMSIATDLKLEQGVLKSTNDLSLHMFELERLRANEMDALSTQLGYPVNTALSMLRDGNGDIRLKIPVEGDLRDPKVGIAGVVRKALLNGTTNSIRSAVQLIYAPLGAVVSVGGKITGQGNVLKCNPVVFAPGKRELAADAGPYLDKLAATMHARPGLRLSLTGTATTEDAIALVESGDEDTTRTRSVFAAAGKAGGRVLGMLGKKEKPEPPNPLPREQMLRLANRRASVVMDYLVTRGGVKPDRIFRRAAAIDQAAAARARVEVSF